MNALSKIEVIIDQNVAAQPTKHLKLHCIQMLIVKKLYSNGDAREKYRQMANIHGIDKWTFG